MPRKYKSRTISLSKAKFVDDYRWTVAFEAIKDLTGVNPKAIRRASRVTPLPAARMMIAYVMHNDLGQTPDYISAQLNKDRTLTYYYISTFPDYIKEGIYKEFYDTFIDLFYHKLKSPLSSFSCSLINSIMLSLKLMPPTLTTSLERLKMTSFAITMFSLISVLKS